MKSHSLLMPSWNYTPRYPHLSRSVDSQDTILIPCFISKICRWFHKWKYTNIFFFKDRVRFSYHFLNNPIKRFNVLYNFANQVRMCMFMLSRGKLLTNYYTRSCLIRSFTSPATRKTLLCLTTTFCGWLPSSDTKDSGRTLLTSSSRATVTWSVHENVFIDCFTEQENCKHFSRESPPVRSKHMATVAMKTFQFAPYFG